jgi:hypothetical protein
LLNVPAQVVEQKVVVEPENITQDVSKKTSLDATWEARKTSIMERREDKEGEYQTRSWAARGERYFDRLGRVKS